MSLPSSGRSARLLGALLALATACQIPRYDPPQAAGPLAQTSVILDADGRVITRLHAEENRVVIPAERIPQVVKDGVVAVEDRRFWTHRGVDLKALLRAAYRNASEGRVVEGGSTITQQYVKNRIVGSEQTVGRKIREAVLAYKLEQRLSKEEILARYLNTVYFGQGAYGIEAAAKQFFSRPAGRLNLLQGALLAGLIAGPAIYDPIDHPRRALERRNRVLAGMLELEMIDRDRFLRVRDKPIRLHLAREPNRYPAAHFVEYVKRQILTDPRFGDTYTQRYNLLFEGGLRIHTTLDLDMQRAAEKAVAGVLSQPSDPYGSLVAVDPRDGSIRAMVGGRDFFARQRKDPFAKINLATGGSTGRQAGSAFKPFALVAAMEQGISPTQTYPGGSSIVLDDPACRSAPGRPWHVQNYEGSSFGTLSIEQATISSVNVVYAQIIQDVGPKAVADTARRMGIRSPLRAYCSAVLGSNEVNPLEMASAYGTLAAGGVHVPPVGIDRIIRPNGGTIFESRPQGAQAVDPAVAWTATQILRKVILHGTGTAANIRRPAGGKTGTAQEWRDAWFAGFIPQLSAAAWVGFPGRQISMVPPRTRIRVTGGSFPAEIWRTFMASVIEDIPVRDFDRPDSRYASVAIDVTQGCVATEDTPRENVRIVRFVASQAPTHRCVVGSLVEIPSVVGMRVKQAVGALEEAGFVVTRTFRFDDEHDPGVVIGQSPSAGTDSQAGSAVTLVVSTDTPPVTRVPDVVGLPKKTAVRELENAGFRVKMATASKKDKAYGAGVTIAQTPDAGAPRPEGSTVTITVNP